MNKHFLRDALEIAGDKVSAGKLSRRDFLALSTAAAAYGVMAPTSSLAAEGEVVFATWGGPSEEAYYKTYGIPFEQETGTKVVMDAEGPSAGRIMAMVNSRNVIWDLCDSGIEAAGMSKQGLFEKIDYSVVSKDRIFPEFTYDWGATTYMFSTVLAYNKEKFGDNPPKTWADFWDVKKFPGKRAMYKYMDCALEIALLADGVAPADVYPINVDRALAKMAEIREHTIFWESGSSSQQLLRDGEVDMAMIWNTRGLQLKDEPDNKIEFSYDNAILEPGIYVVPTGNPAGGNVMKFLAYMQDPKRQIAILEAVGQSPANPETQAMLSPELQARSATSAANREKQFVQRPEWYFDNHADAMKRYLEVISG